LEHDWRRLRSSASQGALNRAVLSHHGLITEADYQEQAQSYPTMQQAAGSHRGNAFSARRRRTKS
jgi:hypothetical protein